MPQTCTTYVYVCTYKMVMLFCNDETRKRRKQVGMSRLCMCVCMKQFETYSITTLVMMRVKV